ncbi:MAG: fused MFS/spermidine synthase [Planctomycetaceae bacterium]|nr:fused MFS/spermidine synthase [Planctomycetaceae bacterium]
MSAYVRRGEVLVFGLATFLSAFLLFQVQPLLAKCILPWFGGTPAVWTTCMLVFQVLLFAGYAYAHLLSSRLTPGWQLAVHLGLLVAALSLLPILPGDDWKPTGDGNPVSQIVLLLLASVGLPYFLLSATGPLLQSWFRGATGGAAPYRLYAVSNCGSLLALVSYPFVVEPNWSVGRQAIVWSAGFVGFAILCAVSGWLGRRMVNLPVQEVASEEAVIPPSTNTILLWFGLAAVPSLFLLAVTNQVCLDVAVIPFLWIVPLTLYLITFILCFDGEHWYRRRSFVLATAVTLACVCVMMMQGAGGSMIAQAIVYFSGLFFAGMVCHGELVGLKPHPRYLTLFYLTISAGGAAGGLFAGLAAPALFHGYFELHVGILACGLLCLGLFLREDGAVWDRLPRWLPGTAGCVILLGAIFGLSRIGGTTESMLTVTRNFYGVLRVEDQAADGQLPARRALLHGRIIHGVQLTGDNSQTPTAYYGENSGIGRILRALEKSGPRKIGMVGLGIGTLATYGQPGDDFTFYEINPDVIRLANDHFTFLKDSAARVATVEGDARLVLERESPRDFDVLVLDAFSGDAIPVHLLTVEAMDVYRKHLAEDGILAIHISNLHFDLHPVLAGLAEAAGWELRTIVSPGDPRLATQTCFWGILGPNGAALDELLGDARRLPTPERQIRWTDDFSNLFEVLR